MILLLTTHGASVISNQLLLHSLTAFHPLTLLNVDKMNGVHGRTKAKTARESDILDVFWIGKRRAIPGKEGVFWIVR